MTTQAFIGRQAELERLRDLRKKKTPSLAVVKGRRRVGKSCLIHVFASEQTQATHTTFWYFSGLAPQEDTDAQDQRDHFARQLANQLKMPPFTFQDWSDAFEHLSHHIQPLDIILLDEISWMGSKDPTFMPKLKDWWDTQKQSMMVFLCGSVSTWIEDNILKSTAFFGRISLTMTLEPLPIPEASALLCASGFRGSNYEIYQLLSILGGIPWYLEQITPGQTASRIIQQLCFQKDALLVLEFDRMFHDVFNGKGSSYKKILHSLKDGMKTLADVRKSIDFSHSGTLSHLMEHLIVAGFVQKQGLWSFKTQKPLKQSLYRICDPYMRFYLKVIEPQRNKMNLDGFQNAPVSKLPGFEAHMGLQLEQLLLQNRNILLQSLGVHPGDTVACGPFRQSQTATKKGCQIDYLVQTTTQTLFLCEFKFKLRELGTDIIAHMQNKIDALKVPRGFAPIPVLFHIGGVSTQLALSDYFYKIIDIADFLTPDV